MKKALFKSVNLIGDALWISPALRAWWEKNKGEYDPPDILTLDDHVAKLYWGMGVPLNRLVYGDIKLIPELKVYDLQHEFHVSNAFQLCDQKQQHLAESYAELLGVELERKPDNSHLIPYYVPLQFDYELNQEQSDLITFPHKRVILISMFSHSCITRNPYGSRKMLDWVKWKPILKTIRKTFPDNPIRFLGAPTDLLTDLYGMDLVRPGEYMLGIPLDRLAYIMRECLFLMTLDNGMGHLAASQRAREFILYPAILHDYYILPWGNKNMRYLHQNPLTVNPAQIVWELQKAWKEWGLV